MYLLCVSMDMQFVGMKPCQSLGASLYFVYVDTCGLLILCVVSAKTILRDRDTGLGPYSAIYLDLIPSKSSNSLSLSYHIYKIRK